MAAVIPHRLHHIWLGPRPVPREWADAWAAMHPSWERRIWREADLAALPMRARAAYEHHLTRGCWHGAADVARLEVLYAEGGVYVDIDSKPLRPFDGAPFMDAGVFAAYEPVPSIPGRVANGTIGAEPGHEAIRSALDIIAGMRVIDPPWDTTGGTTLTAALLIHRRCCDVRVLPAKTFYPTMASGRPTPGADRPYCEHFWSTTNHTYPAKVAVLVPRRAGDPVRDRVWKWARDIWGQHPWPVFVGEHPGPGLFCASIARNAAAKAAGDWDVAIVADADTLPWDWAPLEAAIETAHKTGKFVRPFTAYWQLDPDASETFMREGRIADKGVKRLGEQAHGGIHVVPRRLWDAVGGYDERFVGWGWEDTAFEAACSKVGGGIITTPGSVYHLWHPHQPRDPSTPEYRANVALGKRYLNATPRTIARIIAERGGAPAQMEGALLLVLTNGRREWVGRTLDSIATHVQPISRRLIVDDSGDPDYVAWLRESFDATVIGHRHLGHGPAVRQALLHAARSGVDWVFVCEDDMEFTDPVDLAAIASVMDANPDLAQMVIRRQAWFPAEVAAGPTVIDRFDPEHFTERTDGTHHWLEHRLFYSLNPHLVRREFIAAHPWPARPNSEHHFSRHLFRDSSVKVGMWGRRDDPPRVLHIGTDRTGDGY